MKKKPFIFKELSTSWGRLMCLIIKPSASLRVQMSVQTANSKNKEGWTLNISHSLFPAQDLKLKCYYGVCARGYKGSGF